MAGTKKDTCVCGHAEVAHEHYRRGTDCALCSAGLCPRYRAADGLRGWWHRVTDATRTPDGDARSMGSPTPVLLTPVAEPLR